MFELIGLAFDTVILFAMAAIVSAALLLITWTLVPAGTLRKRLLGIGAIIPLLSAAHFWVCIAVLPRESWFGDISQPLPNGYELSALGKMPDFASIAKPKLPEQQTGLSQCIGKLAVDGPLVVGQYSHPYGTFTPDRLEPFFIFDTRISRTIELSSERDLMQYLGHRVNLLDVQWFQSSEPAYLRQIRINRLIEFVPPLVAIALFALMILGARAGIRHSPPTIYT